MNKTGIEYLDFSWNPIAMRCTPVSEGCAHCWHLDMADRHAVNPKFPDDVRAAYAGEGPPVLVEKRVKEPLRRKKPAMIGTQFMGDLFHEAVSFDFILKCCSVMWQASQHAFLVLTKRPKRLLEFYDWLYADEQTRDPIANNIWLGVTVENQKTADARRDDFERAPAAAKFVSYEPALGQVDWAGWEFVDQIISGGESGPGARPSHPDWHRDVRDFCLRCGIRYFFKQWGAFRPTEPSDKVDYLFEYDWHGDQLPVTMTRVGKHHAGRLLDGKEWNDLPLR